MGKTARLGLKAVIASKPWSTRCSRNGEDSPVGIESVYSVSRAYRYLGRNGEDSPVGIESITMVLSPVFLIESKWGRQPGWD